jgi:hypothetical protein
LAQVVIRWVAVSCTVQLLRAERLAVRLVVAPAV